MLKPRRGSTPRRCPSVLPAAKQTGWQARGCLARAYDERWEEWQGAAPARILVPEAICACPPAFAVPSAWGVAHRLPVGRGLRFKVQRQTPLPENRLADRRTQRWSVRSARRSSKPGPRHRKRTVRLQPRMKETDTSIRQVQRRGISLRELLYSWSSRAKPKRRPGIGEPVSIIFQ